VKTSDWLVESVELSTGKSVVVPVLGMRVGVRPEDYSVYLKITNPAAVDAATHKVRVSYMSANYPDVLFGEPKKEDSKAHYTAAKGKDDADIYLAGNVVAANGSKSKYSIDAKFGYLQSLGGSGAAGFKATFVSETATDIDPDSITVGVTYRKPFVLGDMGLVLRADPVGGEFDREGDNRNLLSSANVKLVFPSAHFGPAQSATIDLVSGFETGNNYENSLAPTGIGGFWRWYGGAGAYLIAKHTPIFQAINFSGEWRVRVPEKAEVFTRNSNTFLTTKPRHHVDSSVDFMFSKAFGISVSYEYGSLPPSFEYIAGKVTAGFKWKLTQTR